MRLKEIFLSLLVIFSFPMVSFSANINEYMLDLKMKGYSFNNDGLSEAIIKKNQEAIEIFSKAGIDFNQVDKEGYTALERAKMTKDNDTLALVSDVIKTSNRKRTFIAANIKNLQLKKDIVQNADNLFLLVKTNNVEGVKKAVGKTKDINVLSEEGLTPLHYAVFNDNQEIVKILLQAGADVNKKSSDGLTPLDVAVLNTQKDTAKIIMEFSGGMSETLAKELEELDCRSFYNEDQDVYNSDFEDIFNAMSLIKETLDNENNN